MPDIGFTSMGVPYQSVLYKCAITTSSCVFTSNQKCDTETPGKLLQWDGIQWYVESETSLCCGYTTDSHVSVEQFVTSDNQSIDYVVPEGYLPPTLEELGSGELRKESDVTSGETVSSNGGGVPIPLMAAVGVIAIAGISMSSKTKGA